MMIKLVTGATGFIGQHVVDNLLLDGGTVRILTRGGSPYPSTWLNRVEVVYGDLNEPAKLKEAVSGCETVLHLAAEVQDLQQMARVNYEGTLQLLDACNLVGVNTFIYLSSVGVMGVRRPGSVDETEPCHPRNHYERSKFDAEKLVLAWGAESGKRAIIIRPTNVFGDGPRNGSDSMVSWLRSIQQGRFVFFDREAISNYVYVKDVADACCRAIESTKSDVVIINDPCMLIDFVAAAAEALSVPQPNRSMPTPIAFAIAIIMQSLAWIVGQRSLLTTSRVRALSIRTCYSTNKVNVEWDWIPPIGYKIGIQRAVQWYRQTGQIE